MTFFEDHFEIIALFETWCIFYQLLHLHFVDKALSVSHLFQADNFQALACLESTDKVARLKQAHMGVGIHPGNTTLKFLNHQFAAAKILSHTLIRMMRTNIKSIDG